MADRLAAVDAILDALPDHTDDLMRAVNQGGAEGLKAFLTNLGRDTGRRLLAALDLPADILETMHG